MCEEQLSKVLLVHRNAVNGVVVFGKAAVGLGAELRADSGAGCEADYADPDFVRNQGADGLMDVAWIGGEERAEDNEDLAGTVAGSVEECCAGHLEGILEAGVSLGFFGA